MKKTKKRLCNHRENKQQWNSSCMKNVGAIYVAQGSSRCCDCCCNEMIGSLAGTA